jgi:hypothetical protein
MLPRQDRQTFQRWARISFIRQRICLSEIGPTYRQANKQHVG